MPTTTMRGSSQGTAAAVVPIDEPEFPIEFRGGGQQALTNSFRWSGPALLRIGPYGVSVSAGRRGLLWLRRKQLRFIASAEILNVYRERTAIRVDLSRQGSQPRFFQFWTGDLKAAATIVALLPTSSTVEFEEGAEPGERFQIPRAPRNSRRSRWLNAAMGLAGVLVTALIVAPRFATRVTAPTPPTARLAQTPQVLSESERLYARERFDRFASRMQGLSTQFSLAFTSLQVGTLQAGDFAMGLENWLLPQWQTLQKELEDDPPDLDSAQHAIHVALAATVTHWQNTLTLYATGLRAHDSGQVLSAFTELKRAEQSEELARSTLADLEASVATSTRSDPRD